MSECRSEKAYRPTEILTEAEEYLQHMPSAPPRANPRKKYSKQLSMCKSRQDMAWEKRRRHERRKSNADRESDLTDLDMKELKGFMDLGFRFCEEDGQRLGSTLPALDMYLVVNRQVCPSPVSTPTPQSRRTSPATSVAGSPTRDSDSWKICSPGDDPKQVKNKLRRWALVVAFSVMHSN